LCAQQSLGQVVWWWDNADLCPGHGDSMGVMAGILLRHLVGDASFSFLVGNVCRLPHHFLHLDYCMVVTLFPESLFPGYVLIFAYWLSPIYVNNYLTFYLVFKIIVVS
jgi:hypothetical protein